jgi:Zn-dependent peptidase ImmA (M78 family)
MNRRDVALEAAKKAFSLRKSVGVTLYDPICVYDFVQELIGVEVHFTDIPSMEAMYRKQPEPLILISSLRPPGRQAFSCGHELGHHEYGHGMRVDQLIDENRNSDSIEELQANLFSAFLLMPKQAVSSAFAKRGWYATCPSPEQIYRVAEWLGVGYTTLIWHMSTSLNLIGQAKARELLKVRPEQIRKLIVGHLVPERLIVVDLRWESLVKAVDAQVGDLILLPIGTVNEGRTVHLVREDSKGTLFRAVAPGIGRLLNPQVDWAVFVRVSRKAYTGRSTYRHYEEYEDDEEESE